MPGVARIAAHIVEPGVVKQAGNFAKIEFAESDGKPSARTSAFHEACKAAGIDAVLSPNIKRDLWIKFAMLAPHAAMTALTALTFWVGWTMLTMEEEVEEPPVTSIA